MSIRTAWLVGSLSLALCLSAGIALAEDGTTVQKTPATTGTVTPQHTPSYDAAEPDAAATPTTGELNPNTGDEGAGWEAAVEAARGPTPLIGEQEDAAVQRNHHADSHLRVLELHLPAARANVTFLAEGLAPLRGRTALRAEWRCHTERLSLCKRPSGAARLQFAQSPAAGVVFIA